MPTKNDAPRMYRQRLDQERVARHAEDERYKHTFWHFPANHPIRQHNGPGVIVAANPGKRRAYVLAAQTQTVHKAAEGLIGRLRHYLRDLNGEAHHQPWTDGSKPAPRPTSLDLPHDLAWDWDRDRPTSFVWLLADPFPPRYWLNFASGRSDKDGMREYNAEVYQRKKAVVTTLERNGWRLYNPNLVRGVAEPGARMAYLDQRTEFEKNHAETLRNHVLLPVFLANNGAGPGLKPEVDPNDANVQRAYARYRVMMNFPPPKPGDPMLGHKSSDHYLFQLEQGELTLNCPLDCPRGHFDWAESTHDA